MSSNSFISSSEGYRNSMMACGVADSIKYEALLLAVKDAEDAGMSIRQTAKALGVRWIDVFKARNSSPTSAVIPIHGSEEFWVKIYRMIWRHNEDMLQYSDCPYKWDQHPDGSRTVHTKPPTGAVRINREDDKK